LELKVVVSGGVRLVEGEPGHAYLANVEDVGHLIEGCIGNGARCGLLYASNLTAQFFDVSSGEAGAVLQKLRTYDIRLAVVVEDDTLLTADFSSCFGRSVGTATSTCLTQRRRRSHGSLRRLSL
jgi:hypothetical protein